MFIQTEATPNPATLKFLPGRAVLEGSTLDLRDAEQAAQSPLAERLFGIAGISGVFFGSDFITVTKADDSDWFEVKPAVLAAIMEHFTAGQPVITGADAGAERSRDLLCTHERPTRQVCGRDVCETPDNIYVCFGHGQNITAIPEGPIQMILVPILKKRNQPDGVPL